MVKLSSYSNGYDDGKFELKPWQFWTEEQKSFVLYKAYQQHYLTSKQVKDYLSISGTQMWTQFLVPAVATGAYFGFLKDSLFKRLYRISPYNGVLGGVFFVGITTVLWANLSPFFVRKQIAQEKLLDALYHKVGISMKALNNAIPRSRTSGQIDRYSIWTYFMRNRINSEVGDDYMPPLLQRTPANNYSNKKMYL